MVFLRPLERLAGEEARANPNPKPCELSASSSKPSESSSLESSEVLASSTGSRRGRDPSVELAVANESRREVLPETQG